IRRPPRRPRHRRQPVLPSAPLHLGDPGGALLRVAPRAVPAALEDRAERDGPELRLDAQHRARPLDGQVRVGRAELEVQDRCRHRKELVAAVICRPRGAGFPADTMPRALRPAPQLLRRAAVAGMLLSLLAPTAALANYISPQDGGSPNANDVNTLYVI